MFFTINTNLAISWVKQNKRKQVKVNRQAFIFNIICKGTEFADLRWHYIKNCLTNLYCHLFNAEVPGSWFQANNQKAFFKYIDH